MSRGSRSNPKTSTTPNDSETQAVGQFLRGLASRADADPALAAQIQGALTESGLLPPAQETDQKSAADKTPAKRSKQQVPSDVSKRAVDEVPDPFRLLREQGEAGLRATLETFDLATLRSIVRANRLDPARISARWSARDRVIELIVTQVLARANFGKAFSRI